MSNENLEPSSITPASSPAALEAVQSSLAEPATPQNDAAPAAAETAVAAESSGTTEAPAKRPITIGSQRDPADRRLSPSEPKPVREARRSGGRKEGGPRGSGLVLPPPNPGGVPVPNRRQRDEALEAELEAALGGASLAELVDASTKESGGELEAETRLSATVARIHQDNVFFTLKGQHEGVASLRSFKTPPEIGQTLEVVVKAFLPDDGLYEVGIPGGAVEVAEWEDIEPGTVVEARITGANTGGLECAVNSIRGFIPASQIDLHRVDNLGDYVNQKLTCVVTESNPRRKNLVLSRRSYLERMLADERKERLAKLEIGSTVPGKVTRLMDFGAFVDIGGGVEGLVHVSKLSWDRISHPQEVLKVGQEVQVKIDRIAEETGKISLSHRDTFEHPWNKIEDRFPVGSVVKGKVSRIAQFGAFVRLEPGIEGLVHISELAHHRVVAVKNHVKEGDEVEVKILSLDPAAQKMALSIKANIAAPERASAKRETVEEEASREAAVPRRDGDLKGGRDRASGGDRFGLNW